jgi:large subunit ribosomal protein L34
LTVSQLAKENAVKVNIRKSTLKKRRLSGYLRRTRTKSGRKILARRRRKGRRRMTST